MFDFLVPYLKTSFINKMLGANCSIFGYSKSRTATGLPILKVLKKDDK